MRKGTRILAGGTADHMSGKKRGRGRPKSSKNITFADEKEKISQTKSSSKLTKTLAILKTSTHHQQNNNNNSSTAAIAKKKLSQLKSLARRKTNEAIEKMEGASDTSSSDSDAESIDLSEKANRIEGAGGSDFHYFCRICKFVSH